MKTLLCAIAITAAMSTVASAGEVDVRLSTREAYVGQPIVLQLAIMNSKDYEQPALPSIDGCDIRSAGTPSQSSQITIVNGRRSEKRSVTMQYLITPRREGSFTIPALSLKVDGTNKTTDPISFVATKSETGDLLFVEIEGRQDKVFVGQPLDLTLKIWIKPFRDARADITLSEGDMWNMISRSTSWGGFAERMQELAENNQRPAGHEVLRDDADGNQRSYYLYEINATIYPKRAGKIEADDVQIVVNYPTALGKSRSPFGDLFDDDLLDRNSSMSRMLQDDFFNSAFGNRLTVAEARPIVGNVSVDATEVLPVPLEGRPENYRGAVGRYRIITHATPDQVAAGDPITLNIGIAGNGPMDLIQAPPLSEDPELTKDFKVTDEPLAGYVQKDTKLFSTTIRPRREGVTEIPAIGFSFFDPETEKYETVTSAPISISVTNAETLSLDDIVGNAHRAHADDSNTAVNDNLPDLNNHSGSSVLISQTVKRSFNDWWMMFVVVPPMVWMFAMLTRYQGTVYRQLPSFRSPKTQCLTGIDKASDQPEIDAAIIRYLLRMSRGNRKLEVFSSDTQTLKSHQSEAVGTLRLTGLYQVAGEVETFLTRNSDNSQASLEESKMKAAQLVEEIDTAMQSNQKSRVKAPKSRIGKVAVQRPLGLLFAFALVASAQTVSAADAVALSTTQQQALLTEANEAYATGIEKSQTDAADAKELFSIAGRKYQLLIDSNIQNADLFINLGNTCLQTGQLGSAIANYEKALQLEPHNRQAIKNLNYANTKIENASSVTKEELWSLRGWNNSLVGLAGERTITWTLAISSVLFWGLLILRLYLRTAPVWQFALLPLSLLIVYGASVAMTQTNPQQAWNAVIISDHVSLHAGDGDQFDEVFTVESAQGQRVETLAQRGDWCMIKTTDGHTGWIHARDVEIIKTI
ncbi:MAG TPA: hypothetical protein DD473_06430 [Planctomycetaceae bacterium]|nr:hypothetical protein [Planctomycetaceae bacterium]